YITATKLDSQDEFLTKFVQQSPFYRKHRHAIFHMEEFPNGSRMINTLDSAIGLSKDAYSAIDALMQ
ncbi:hypothetical protein, partial [Paracoccus fontiphilus]